MDILADVHLSEVISTLIYCGIGLGFFLMAYFILERVMPFPVRFEIEEDQNTALGIIIGSMIIGLAIIIAAAIAAPSGADKTNVVVPIEVPSNNK
jgi:putative membrane protein